MFEDLLGGGGGGESKAFGNSQATSGNYFQRGRFGEVPGAVDGDGSNSTMLVLGGLAIVALILVLGLRK